MNTQVLEYLIAISEEKSLTRAAERFYLSQPSLSHHLANVEKELGVKLFRREGRALLPTEDGIIFINNAQAILHAEAQARQRIEEIRTQKQLHLRVSAFPLECIWLQQAVLPLLSSEQPQIQVQLTPCASPNPLSSLDSEEQDAVFLLCRTPFPDNGRQHRTLWKDTLCFAVPAGPACQELPPDLGNLGYFRFQAESALDRGKEESLQDSGLHPQMTCIAADLKTTVGMVAAGHGCAFLPQSILNAVGGSIAVSSQVKPWDFTGELCYRPPRSAEYKGALEALAQAILQTVQDLSAYSF